MSAAAMKLWERQVELGQAWQRIALMGFHENGEVECACITYKTHKNQLATPQHFYARLKVPVSTNEFIK